MPKVFLHHGPYIVPGSQVRKFSATVKYDCGTDPESHAMERCGLTMTAVHDFGRRRRKLHKVFGTLPHSDCEDFQGDQGGGEVHSLWPHRSV